MRGVFAVVCGLALAAAGAADAPPERYRLYTAPDPAAAGGIALRIAGAAGTVRQVLAIPFDRPECVYAAAPGGGGEVRFAGLPMDRYDLLVISDRGFYEGLRLHRGESTLTADDRNRIQAIVERSEPFFTRKTIHRVDGETGRGHFARCICTFLRDKPSELMATGVRSDYRRTLKLVMLKDVGPGWQVVRARDLFPEWVAPAEAALPHRFCARLGGVRVTDSVKDLGEINVSE